MYERESNSRVVVAVDANKSKEKVEISCHCCSDLESECVLKFSVDIGMIWSSNNMINNILVLPSRTKETRHELLSSAIEDGGSFCYCAYVLRISRWSAGYDFAGKANIGDNHAFCRVERKCRIF